MTDDDQPRHIVVGVTEHQPPTVLQTTARFARKFGAIVVCAHVETGNYVVEEYPDGSVESRPIDSDLVDWDSPVFDPDLADRLRSLAAEHETPVEFRELAGDTASALARLADVLDAEMIVVGSRRGGIGASMHDFLGGSVAVHLAHRQPRPLVVVPLAPVGEGSPLPWDETAS